jgi:hypothetical protein
VTESVKQFVGCDLPDSSPPAVRGGHYLVNVSFRAILIPFDGSSRQQGNVRNLSIAFDDRKEPLFTHRSIIPEHLRFMSEDSRRLMLLQPLFDALDGNPRPRNARCEFPQQIGIEL